MTAPDPARPGDAGREVAHVARCEVHGLGVPVYAGQTRCACWDSRDQRCGRRVWLVSVVPAAALETAEARADTAERERDRWREDAWTQHRDAADIVGEKAEVERERDDLRARLAKAEAQARGLDAACDRARIDALDAQAERDRERAAREAAEGDAASLRRELEVLRAAR